MKAAVEPTISLAGHVSCPVEKKKPESPSSQPPPPNASAKPQTHHAIEAIEKLTTILAIPMPAFFPREKPISRNANPACMNITSTAATRIHSTFSSSTTVSRVGASCASATAGSASVASVAPANAAAQHPVTPHRSVLLVGLQRLAVCAPRREVSLSLCRRFCRRAFVHPVERANGRRGSLDTWTRTRAAGASTLSFDPGPVPEEDARKPCPPEPVPPTSPPPSGAPTVAAHRPVGPHAARRQRLRRERLLDRRPAPAAAEGRLQAAPGDDRGGRDARPGARRRRRQRHEGMGDRARRHALHALVPAADRPDGREARLVLRARRATAARSPSSPARS